MYRKHRIGLCIPGVNTIAQLEENVKGSYERDTPLTKADRRAIEECTANYHAHLTPGYQWLRQWETV